MANLAYFPDIRLLYCKNQSVILINNFILINCLDPSFLACDLRLTIGIMRQERMQSFMPIMRWLSEYSPLRRKYWWPR